MLNFNENLQKARKSYEDGEYDKALNQFINLYNEDCDKTQILPYIIFSYLYQGDFVGLVKYFEEYANLDISDEEIKNFLNTSFSIFNSLNINEFSLNVNKAQFLIKFEYFKPALKYLDNALAIKSKDVYVLNLKAFSLYNLGHFDDSLKLFSKVTRIDNLNYEAWKFKAQILYVDDEDEKAMKAFQKALSIDCSDIFVWREFISSCVFSGHLRKAIKECNNALKIFPNDLDLLLDKFDIYMYDENFKQAKIVADTVAREYPNIIDQYLAGENDKLNDDLISFVLEGKPYNDGDYIFESNFFDDLDDVGEDDFDLDFDDLDLNQIFFDFLKSAFIKSGDNTPIFSKEGKEININMNDIINLFLFDDTILNKEDKNNLLNILSKDNDLEVLDGNNQKIDDYIHEYEKNLQNLLENLDENSEEFEEIFKIKTIFDDCNFNIKDDLKRIIFKATVLFQYKKYLNAYAYLSEADKIAPKNIYIILLKSAILFYQGEYEDSLRYANMALIIDKYNYFGWVFKAFNHIYLEDMFNALQSFNVALSIDNKEKSLWRMYYLSVMYIGNMDLAIKLNHKALEIFPDDSQLWSDRSLIIKNFDKDNDDLKDDKVLDIDFNSKKDAIGEDINLSPQDYIDYDYFDNLVNIIFNKFTVKTS